MSVSLKALSCTQHYAAALADQALSEIQVAGEMITACALIRFGSAMIFRSVNDFKNYRFKEGVGKGISGTLAIGAGLYLFKPVLEEFSSHVADKGIKGYSSAYEMRGLKKA